MALIVDGKDDDIALALFDSDVHPVTAVRCDSKGMLFFDRYNATPLWLNASYPSESRRVFLQHVIAAVDEMADEKGGVEYWNRPMSGSGRGLSRRQLREQTYAAVMKSRRIEEALRDAFNRKYSQERVANVLKKLRVTQEDIERINSESPLVKAGLEYRLVNLGDKDKSDEAAVEIHRV